VALVAGVITKYTAVGNKAVPIQIPFNGLSVNGLSSELIAYNAMVNCDVTNFSSRIFIFNQCLLYQLLNWSVTTTPIWFIGMTLYQRTYACKDEKKKLKKAWFHCRII
jgi:SSS family solute:Na+ symporter